jgi:hypothetical protein
MTVTVTVIETVFLQGSRTRLASRCTYYMGCTSPWQTAMFKKCVLQLPGEPVMHSMRYVRCMRSMRGGLFSVVEGPCKRYAMAQTRMSAAYNE